MTDTNNDAVKARDVFERYGDAFLRGHDSYMSKAMELEDYYLGGGRQWKADDRAEIEGEGRPCYEVNQVFNSVNAAVGYQIANRVDVSFVPRGGQADEYTAKLLSKVIRQCLDNTCYQDKETDACFDGFIQQRAYFDVTMNYENNDLGEPHVRIADNCDVLPDPDGKENDVDTWADVHEARWLTLAQIEGHYGADAAALVKANSSLYADDRNFGEEHGIYRPGFSERLPGFYGLSRGYLGNDGPWRRYRIVSQQTNVYKNTLVARWPTGDIHSVEGLPREHIAWLLQQGIPVFRRRMRRVHWRVVAPEVTLHDLESPYDHITLVPFFPYFRKGRTIGMVDNQVSVQDMLNKFVSQFAHVVNSSANGGWQGESGVLVNMDDDEFVTNASSPGLILLRKPGSQPFTKIEANPVPTGLDRMVEFAHQNARVVTGIDETLSTMNQKDLSGVAIQSLQFAQQQKLAPALANLSKARKGVVMRVLECVQKFMGAERIMRIAEMDPYGVKKYTVTPLNARMPDGTIYNDLTVGTYDLVLTEQPSQVTFDNSQFEQIINMREKGIRISDARVIRASNLIDKSEIAEEVAQLDNQPDPLTEADVALKLAQARVAEQTAVAKAIEAQFSAIKTAREIVITPETAAIADALLRSGGFKDADAAPIVPEAPAHLQLAPPAAGAENSHPQFPPNPQAGLTTGMDSTT